jgi:uncharacterized repeat protein (TIGR01451 family)
MVNAPGGRDVLAAVGIVLAAVGVLTVVGSPLGGLGVGEAAVMALGILALLNGLWLVRQRWRRDVDQAITGTPEEPREVPTPGTEFDRTLGYRAGGEQGRPFRDRIRSRLDDVAEDVSAQFGGTEAGGAETGTDAEGSDRWTYRTDDSRESGPLPRWLSGGVRGVFGGESAFQRRVREAVDALLERAGLDGRPLPTLDEQPLPEDPLLDRGRRRPAVDPADGGSGVGEGLVLHERSETGRWRGVKAVALVSIGVGIVSKQPAPLLAGIAGFGFAGYAHSATPGAVEVDLERELSDDEPTPGDAVRVTVTVRNDGGETLPDLRVVDGVPAALPVTDGSPRTGVALRPGKRARFSYTVIARRGEHRFAPATLIARDATGAIEREFTYAEETRLVCLPEMRPAAAAPLRSQGTGFAGQVRADAGGGGTEFHATREYRHGDPLNRIDWKRRARTGELATTEFRQERLATVQVVVDAREAGRVAPPGARATSLDYSAYAAGRLFTALLAGGNRVGLATASAPTCWLAPGSGEEHRARGRELLARDGALAPVATDANFDSLRWLDHLRRRLPGDAQLVVIGPLSDDLGGLLPRWIEGYGFPVTVLSPDPTGDRTTGQRLARLERAVRLTDLRSRGIRVVDWGWEEPLDVALLRARERWRS